jgi:tetratricopeptide (TPR) repeat protein
MNTAHLTTLLRQYFSPKDLVIFTRSLSREPLLWQAILQEDFFTRAREKLGNHASDWSPAAIALFHFDPGFSVEELVANPGEGLPGEIRQKAVQAYDDFRHRHDFSTENLAEVALVALALRERARILGSWEGVWREFPNQNFQAIQLVLACTFGLLVEPEKYFRSLCQESKQLEMCAEVIYAQPLTQIEQNRMIARLSQTVRASDRLRLLKKLETNHPDDARMLASECLFQEKIELQQDIQNRFRDGKQTLVDFWSFPETVYLAEITRLAGKTEKSIAQFQLLDQGLQELKASLQEEVLRQAIQVSLYELVDEQLISGEILDRFSPEALSRIALQMIADGQSQRAQALVHSDRQHPAVLIVQAALLSQDNDPDPARRVLLQALNQWDALARSGDYLLFQTASLAMKLMRPDLTLCIIRYLSQQNPQDTEILLLGAQAARQTGNISEALDFASSGILFSPESQEFSRELALGYEAAGEWQSASQERWHLLNTAGVEYDQISHLPHLNHQILDDLRSVAVDTLYAGNPQEAINICNKVIQNLPGDGLTMTILGKIKQHLGDQEQALEIFQQANQIAPDEAETWLCLAKAYLAIGEDQRALETLRTAVQAVPDNASIHLALAEIYQSMDQQTQALSSAMKAADLEGLPYQLNADNRITPHQTEQNTAYLHPDAGRIARVLGKLLYDLGHPDQAAVVLGYAYHSPSQQGQVAHDYARALLAIQKDRQALAALTLAYQKNPADCELALEYARLLMKLGEAPETAATIFEKLINEGNESPEIVALLAEALTASMEFTIALERYQQAMHSSLMQERNWSIRLALGMSHVAIELKNPDLAVAALQDVLQYAPDHLVVHQKLCEACFAAGLSEDAQEVARQALEIAPADTENLIWYANQMLTLDAPEQALQALTNAVELSPQNPGLLIQMAAIQYRLGNQDKAHANYTQAAGIPEVTLQQLYEIGKGLMQLNDPVATIECLEKVRDLVLEYLEDAPDNPPGMFPSGGNNQPTLFLSLLTLLAEAYERVGDAQQAIQILDTALQHNKNSSLLLKQKARIHLQVNQFHAASACLTQIINNSPEEAEAYALLAEIHLHEGNLLSALEKARKYAQYASNAQRDHAFMMAAQLAWNVFQTDETRQYLADISQNITATVDVNTKLEHLYLRGLLALDEQDKEAIFEIADQLTIAGVNTPIATALQAVRSLISHESDEARQHFQLADLRHAESEDPDSLEFEILYQTAALLGEFSHAQKIIEAWQGLHPTNPRVYLSGLRNLTEAEETARFLREVGARMHPLIQFASSNNAFETGEVESVQKTTAISYLAKILSLLGINRSGDLTDIGYHTLVPSAVKTWQIRAAAVGLLYADSKPETFARGEVSSALLNELGRLPANPANTVALASALRKAGQKSQSIRVTRDFPNHGMVLAQCALSYLDENPVEAMGAALGATEAAITGLDIKILPAYHALIALAAYKTQNYKQAYQALTTALTDWPDEPNWHYLAAQISQHLGDLSASIQHLEKAVNLHPNKTAYRLQLAELYQSTGAINRAEAVLAALCKMAPQQPDNWIKLAEVQVQKGSMAEAIQSAEKALSLRPESPEITLFVAELNLLTHHYPRCIEMSRSVLEKEPVNSLASLLLARAYGFMNRRKEALEVLDFARSQPDCPIEIDLERVRLLRSLQGLQPAYLALLELGKEFPDHPLILALQAEYLQEMGQVQEALQAAQRALQVSDQGLSLEDRSRLHALAGRILRRAGQLDQAVVRLGEAIKLNPQKIELYLELGKTHQERRQLREAMNIYQRAIELAPNDPRPYQQAGLALKDSKDYLGAENMIRRAAELSPHDISIHRLLGSLVALNLVHNAQ